MLYSIYYSHQPLFFLALLQAPRDQLAELRLPVFAVKIQTVSLYPELVPCTTKTLYNDCRAQLAKPVYRTLPSLVSPSMS